MAHGHGSVASGEALCNGEAVTVQITGRLRRVFGSGGHFWAQIEACGVAAGIGEYLKVPLICVRMADKLHPEVKVPDTSPRRRSQKRRV